MKYKKGQIPWNKNLTKETDERVRKISENLKEKHALGLHTTFKKGNTFWKNRKESGQGNKKRFSKELVSCACGCGNLRLKYDRDGKQIRFINGHKSLKWYESMKEKVWGNPEVIKNMVKNNARYWLGRKRPKEAIEKQRIFMVGENNPFYGEKHKKENIEKIKKARAKQRLPLKDTKIELKIQDFLTALKIEFVTHKYMNIKHFYQCDILVPSMNLVIECDGDFFHMNPNKFSPEDKCFKNGMTAKEKWELDENRTKELIEKGYKVIRLWENEIKVMKLNEFKEIVT